MSKRGQMNLSRRERQIMDAIYRLGRASVADVLRELPDPPSYSAVRAMLRILEEKGYLRHVKEGPRYVFLSTLPRRAAARSALKHMLETFFEGSTEKAVAALLDASASALSDQELDRLADLIEEAKRKGD